MLSLYQSHACCYRLRKVGEPSDKRHFVFNGMSTLAMYLCTAMLSNKPDLCIGFNMRAKMHDSHT